MAHPRHSGAESLRPEAFTLLELLVVGFCLGAMTLMGLRIAGDSLAAERVETATRRLAQGIERGRLAAQREGRACAMALLASGVWQSPGSGSLMGCDTALQSEGEGIDPGQVEVEHNLPAVLRISSNGLVLDGGTIRISARGSERTRCLVISLPLGVVRWGYWQQSSCQPERAS